MHQVTFTIFGLRISPLFVGTVYNLTLKLTNATYDESLASPHSPQFIKLRTDFEVGVSMQKLGDMSLKHGDTSCFVNIKFGMIPRLEFHTC